MSVQYAALVMIAESAYADWGLYPHPEAIQHIVECAMVCDSYNEAEEFIECLADAAAEANEMEL